MAAGIFGALAALGGVGNQAAEGRQLAHEEVVRRLAEQQAQQAATLNQQVTRQRIAKGAQDIQAGKQPLALGQPYVSGGKTYQRYQDPMTGAISNKELPGGAPETKIEGNYRGLMAIGMPPEEAGPAAIKMVTGRTAEKREVVPDPSSPTGFSAVYHDSEGVELWRSTTLPPRTAVPRETDRTSTDSLGLTTHSHSVTRPVFGASGPGAIAGAGSLPPAAGAPGGATAPRGNAIVQGLASSRPADGKVPAATAPKAAPSGPGQTLAVGPYRGLDPQGQIPPRAGLNDQVRQYANDILAGRDVMKIPGKARAVAEALAARFGWKGQGSLTPAQQMQIEQVDNSLATLSDPKFLKLFDSTFGRLRMSTVPLDPTGEGGFGGLTAAINRGTMTQDQAEYMNALTRLRGVIGGIRGFTGANNSNATADRLLAELPNFTNTKNSADAKNKLDRLRQEVSIIKRLGFFLPDSPAGGGAPAAAAAPAADSQADQILKQAGVIQ